MDICIALQCLGECLNKFIYDGLTAELF